MPRTGSPVKAAMVEQIKQMQRNEPVAQEQWHAYCEAFGNHI